MSRKKNRIPHYFVPLHRDGESRTESLPEKLAYNRSKTRTT